MNSTFWNKLVDERIFLAFLALFVFNLPFSEAVKEISLVVVFILIFLRMIEDGFSLSSRIFVLGFPVILFSVVSLFSALHSINRMQALRGFWGDLETLMAWIVFAGAFQLISDRQRTIRIVVFSLAAGLFAGGLVGLYRMVALNEPNMGVMNLGDKNSSAQFLSMAFLLFLGMGTMGEKPLLSWKWLGLFLFMTGGLLILCHSRSFLISVPLSSLLFLAMVKRWKILLGVGGTILFSAGLLSLFSHLRWEMTTLIHPTQDGSFTSRYETWKGTIRIFRDHPLLGIGPDTFQMANIHKLYKLPSYASHGHNIFFNLLGEYGLLGTLAFAMILVLWVARVIRDQEQSSIGRFLKAMTISFILNLLLAGIAHPMWGGSSSMIFMMVMALVLIAEEEIRGRRQSGFHQGHSVPVFSQRHLH